jgi:hypothetical protein
VILGGKEIKYGYDAVMLPKKVPPHRYKHVFIDKPGHFAEDTFLNRREIVKTYSKPENYLGKD